MKNNIIYMFIEKKVPCVLKVDIKITFIDVKSSFSWTDKTSSLTDTLLIYLKNNILKQ